MKKNSEIKRREFITRSSSALLGSMLYSSLPGVLQAADKSKVVLVRKADLHSDNGEPRPEAVNEMIDEAVTALVDASDADQFWTGLIKPEDIVGIKTNVVWYLPTPETVNDALLDRVKKTGVKTENIALDDRGVRGNPVFQKATKLINVRPLRTHHWSGVGSLIKNYIMFSDHPPDYHPDSCADLGKLWHLPQVKDKTCLNLLIMFRPLFHGVGPHHYNPKYTWAYNGLLAGFDPVAVDSIGVEILRAKRQDYFGENRPINPPPKHIAYADSRYHLGNASLDRVDLVTSGWNEGRLI